MNELTDEYIKQVYRRIAFKYEAHGDFLTAFAEAVVRADLENFQELRERAVYFIEKYKLPQVPFKGEVP